MNDECKIPVPSRPYITVECACGEMIPGQKTWADWDRTADVHMGVVELVEAMAAAKSKFSPIVLEQRPDGSLRTMEMCSTHGLTVFSVRRNHRQRVRRCLACDRSRKPTSGRNRKLNPVTS